MMSEHNIKLAAIDMDGTLLNSRKEIPPDFIDWVISHPHIQVVISSGRQYYNLKELFAPAAAQLIFSADNGGLVFAQDELIYQNEMTVEDILRCLERLDGQEGLSLILCGARSAYMKHSSPVVEDNAHMYYARLTFTDNLKQAALDDCIVKIAVFVENQKAEEVFRKLSDLGEPLAAVLSGDSWIDISNKTVSKGTALTAILNRLHIPKAQSIAFGDYLNDYDLLLSCGESYAMANAHPELKAIARHITASNDDQGVMQVLRRL
ncbi:MAG: HAD family hydrolase [Bacteroidales bacterium]|nr:HAD family hydrolase [Clostridium sp.]MCM1204595.1 HAD family hydrolase [Bacteroidales bacterium]